jgi:leucyl-tRNA synthetase
VSRLGLADAGDSVEDANFVEETANSLILRLFLLIEWMKEVCSPSFVGRSGPIEALNDVVFESEINKAIALTDRAYSSSLYREAMKTGFYEFQTARDRYRELTHEEGMHKELVLRSVEVQVLLLAPITPHFSEHIWSEVLKKGTSIMHARWPEGGLINETVLAGSRYFDRVIHEFRLTHMGQKNPRKGPKPTTPLEKMKIYIATSYPDWQVAAVELLSKHFDQVLIVYYLFISFFIYLFIYFLIFLIFNF